jgi:DNA primase
MNYRIPKEKVDEILLSVDLLDIVARDSKLFGKGKNAYAYCPFHQVMGCFKKPEVIENSVENTPSLIIGKKSQLYRCSACGASGNAVHYLMGTKKISFIKSIRMLSNIGGVKIKC